MDYLPPLRNYNQIVRVVRDDTTGDHLAKHAVDFKLGNAFGEHQSNGFDSLFSNGGISPTELQMRTLDSMNLPSSSLRRPGNTKSGGLLPTRAGSLLFHDLNPSTRDYINGMNGGQTMNRLDAQPGTKLRTQLDPSASNKRIHQQGHQSNHNDHRVTPSHLPAPHITTNNRHTASSHPSHTFSH